MRRLLRVLCLAVLGLMVFDNIADAAGCPDSGRANAVECHACACSAHIAPQRLVQIVPAPQPVAYVPYEPTTYAVLVVDSFFQPPRLAA